MKFEVFYAEVTGRLQAFIRGTRNKNSVLKNILGNLNSKVNLQISAKVKLNINQ